MFKYICLVAIIGVACAAPQGKAYRPTPAVSSGSDKFVGIVRQANDANPDGSYQWSFESENGIAAQEQGAVKNAGQKDAEALEVQGSFQYTAPDGTPFSVHYVANENGFQPEGAHLPVAPEVPAAIARALAYIAAHPQQEEKVVSVGTSGNRRY